jgi:hypothetical protein
MQLQLKVQQEAAQRQADRQDLVTRAAVRSRGFWLPGDDEQPQQQVENDNPLPSGLVVPQ